MLHIVYRSYGGENKKGRPDYYSKRMALLSLVRAFRAVPAGQAELIFLNDGPIPEPLLRLMEQSGEVVACERMGLRRSLRTALTMPKARGWAGDDLVWFSEDDYLYLPDAMTGLIAGAKAFPHADYFALYSMIGKKLPTGEQTTGPVPKTWADTEPVLVQNHPWRHVLSATSTFGARVAAVNADLLLMDLAINGGSAFDHTTCLMLQGYAPYTWSELTGPVRRAQKPGAFFYALAAATYRSGLNLYTAIRTLVGAPRRIWAGPDPALSTHLETELLAAGSDWRAIAAETEAWALRDGQFAPAQ